MKVILQMSDEYKAIDLLPLAPWNGVRFNKWIKATYYYNYTILLYNFIILYQFMIST